MIRFTFYLKPLILTTGLVLTPISYAIDYTYDNLNRLIKASYPTGQTIVYTYDAVGNLLSVTLVDNQSQNTDTENQVASADDAVIEEKTATP